MLSKPKLESSAGRKSTASISTASRSRMALRYSVRFSRWKVAVRPGLRVTAQERSSSPSSHVRNASTSAAAGRGRAAGGMTPPRSLRDHLLPRVRMPADVREIEGVEGEPDGTELPDERRRRAAPAVHRVLVVAGDAVTVEQRAVGGAIGRRRDVRDCRLGGLDGSYRLARRRNGLPRRRRRGLCRGDHSGARERSRRHEQRHACLHHAGAPRRPSPEPRMLVGAGRRVNDRRPRADRRKHAGRRRVDLQALRGRGTARRAGAKGVVATFGQGVSFDETGSTPDDRR